MKKNSRILVLGDDTSIGKSIINELKENKYSHILNFKLKKNQLISRQKLDKYFLNNKPEYIFLCHGITGGILFNQNFPVELMNSNLNAFIDVIPMAYKHKVKKLVYFASSCVYPKDSKGLLKISDLFKSYLEETNLHYAISKLSGIILCDAYNKQFNTSFIPVIPSNYFGPGDDFNPKNSHLISALINKMHDAKLKRKKNIKIWGSGKPVRDFTFLKDIADGSIHIMKNYKGKEPLNLTSGLIYSVKEVAYLVKKITSYEGDIIFDKSKKDGMKVKKLDATPLKKIGWNHKYGIENSLIYTYKWFKENKII